MLSNSRPPWSCSLPVALALLSATIPWVPPAAAQSSDGPLAHFRFDESPGSAGSLELSPVVHGSLSYAPGPRGRAAVFDGNTWIEVPHQGNLTFDLDTQPYTIAAFFKIDVLPTTSDPTILQDRIGSNHSVSYNLLFNGNADPQTLCSNSWYGLPSGVNFAVCASAAGLVGSWHHVGVTYTIENDNGQVTRMKQMYIDGVAAGAPVAAPGVPFEPGPGNTLTIGAYYGSCECITNFFVGQLDDLRIYNRALSSAEMAQLANPNPDGLVAYYPFDGDARDWSGSGFDGSWQGPSAYVPGRRGQAAAFNGINSWIRVDHGGALTFDPDTQSYTVATFFRLNELGDNDPCIVQDRYGSNHSVSYNLVFDSDVEPRVLTANTWYSDTGTNFVTVVPATGLVGAWHHAAVTFDAATGSKRMFIDGIEVSLPASRPDEAFVPGPGDALTIGAYYGSCSCITSFLNGQIDELRIYNRALSQEEIEGLSNGCRADFNGDGITNSQDFFDFLSSFFAGS
jgi:hypothetical protein